MKIFSTAFYNDFDDLYGQEVYYINLAEKDVIKEIVNYGNIGKLIYADETGKLFWSEEEALNTLRAIIEE